MATVTGLTAERMGEIEAAAIVDAEVVGDNLHLIRHDAAVIDAGSVRGPQGDQGPPGSGSGSVSVLSATLLGTPGVYGQSRVGRQLAVADFTNLGLTAPLALYNLANNSSDSSGNARNLTNKGTVGYVGGINGIGTSAAIFTFENTKALYLVDSGANDPFRIKVGSIGGWFRCPKRDVAQGMVSKMSASAGNYCWVLYVTSDNKIGLNVYFDGTSNPSGGNPVGTKDIADNNWHFVTAIFDGTHIKIYIDGALDVESDCVGTLFAGNGPLNLGGQAADSTTATTNPFCGNLDEIFITSDILTEDQVKNLMCLKISHSLAAVPSLVTMGLHRQRRGGTLASGDFTSTLDRLYNFTAGALTDAGTDNTPVVAQGTTTSIFDVAGADGARGNAKSLEGAHQGLASTDAGLPSGTSGRSYGGWFKTTGVSMTLIQWGTAGSADAKLSISADGKAVANSGSDAITGPVVNDGKWHQILVTETNSPADANGIKRKMYVDGRLLACSTTLNSLTLAGALKFRIGADTSGTSVYIGEVDGVFVAQGAMGSNEIWSVYHKGYQTLPHRPWSSENYVEAVTSTDIYASFMSLEACDQLDMTVLA